MPRTLKRRSDALNDHHFPSSISPSPQPTRRGQRTPTSSSSPHSTSPEPSAQRPSSTTQTLVKKLVRLALATEHSRTPLRRTDISSKILTDASASRQFKIVFAGAQQILRETFGMEMTELPSKEKTTLKDRRAQATQRNGESQIKSTNRVQGGNTTSKSWILTSTLPPPYKTNPLITTPSLAPSASQESTYIALYTLIISLIYLHGGTLPDNRLIAYLKRMNLEEHTPLEIPTEKLLARMAREGYVEKRRDTSSGEEVIEWVVGSRGKVEVGTKGVRGLVRRVYGVGDGENMEEGDEEELEKRINRSLGVKAERREVDGDIEMVNGEEEQQQEPEPPQQRRRGRPRRTARDEDSDDD